MTGSLEAPASTQARPPLRSVAVLTLGCKLNLAESDAIARALRLAGCAVVDRPAAADAFVINSCSVTHVADRKSRHLVRLARRLSPEATILLTGCFPETAGVDAARAVGADLVVPSRDKDEVVRRLFAVWAPDTGSSAGCQVPGSAVHLASHGQPDVPWNPAPGTRHPAPTPGPRQPTPGSHTRAFVKAQEGCNDICAFCIVPRTRGRERSLRPEDVVATVRERAADGAQEVVITGTQLGAYGRDLDPHAYGPAAVIRALLAETSVSRIRFSSLQPQDITPDLLALWEDPRLCRHFHLALQSGSDPVLRRMRRRYSLQQYREALAAIRWALPDVAVTTDVLVGFPGETRAEHGESLAFCREAGFAQMHVFPYSRRPGTTANLLAEHVPEPEKKARLGEMLALARESAAAFRRRFLGSTAAVLWEEATPQPDGGPPRWDGLTDNYIRVHTRSAAALANRLLPVRLTGEAEDALTGELLPAGTP